MSASPEHEPAGRQPFDRQAFADIQAWIDRALADATTSLQRVVVVRLREELHRRADHDDCQSA